MVQGMEVPYTMDNVQGLQQRTKDSKTSLYTVKNSFLIKVYVIINAYF